MAGGMLAGWAHQGGPGDFVVSLPRLDGIFWGKIRLDWSILGDHISGCCVRYGQVFAKILYGEHGLSG